LPIAKVTTFTAKSASTPKIEIVRRLARVTPVRLP
jgi:hypothetical protein